MSTKNLYEMKLRNKNKEAHSTSSIDIHYKKGLEKPNKK